MSRSRALPPIGGLAESSKLGGTGLLSSTGIVSLQRLPATDKKKDICVRSLSEGFVQSFVDLFHLSYREPVLVDEASERYFSVPQEMLFTLRDSLITAERSTREGDFISAFESYIGLAEYFESNQDRENTVYYFEKALEAARKSSDVEVESRALEIVGSAYERLGLEERAIGFHENQLRLSKANQYTEGEVKARENLISVYMKFAGACVDKKNYLDAAHYLGRASDVAETSGQLERRARIQHRLSQVYFLAGEYANAQRIEETCLQTCDENGWKDLQQEVLVGLARIMEQNDDFGGAIDSLEEYLRGFEDALPAETTENGELIREKYTVKGEVLQQLGMLLNRVGRLKEAAKCFEENFVLARQTGNKKLIDQARVMLGLARGNAGLMTYMKMVDSDLPSLLQWKNGRKLELKDGSVDETPKEDEPHVEQISQ
eukprot:TRINITY_DN81058_c0_g1_i1.p1 TRINITY_DN81058_c0_g1~~TRINITY_DN81058_c0_g1_i1.p1  ORF type:complete len:432 (-),score=119.57 TRINITY_DN81058_c0_g1_i1:101-1396(-)